MTKPYFDNLLVLEGISEEQNRKTLEDMRSNVLASIPELKTAIEKAKNQNGVSVTAYATLHEGETVNITIFGKPHIVDSSGRYSKSPPNLSPEAKEVEYLFTHPNVIEQARSLQTAGLYFIYNIQDNQGCLVMLLPYSQTHKEVVVLLSAEKAVLETLEQKLSRAPEETLFYVVFTLAYIATSDFARELSIENIDLSSEYSEVMQSLGIRKITVKSVTVTYPKKGRYPMGARRARIPRLANTHQPEFDKPVVLEAIYGSLFVELGLADSYNPEERIKKALGCSPKMK